MGGASNKSLLNIARWSLLPIALSAGMARADTPAARNAGRNPTGINVGGFTLFPRIAARLAYDDNIFLDAGNRSTSDAVADLEPSLSVTSNWSNHQLFVEVGSHHRRYDKTKSQNTDEYHVRANGRLDVTRTFTVSAGGGYQRATEARGTPGSLLTNGTPVEYDLGTASVQVAKGFNRVLVSVNASTQRYRYSSVRIGNIIQSQKFRDRNVDTAGARLGYQLSPMTTVFVQGQLEQVRYRDSATVLGRNSNGKSVLGGLKVEFSSLLEGEVAVGYTQRKFTNSSYGDFKGLDYNISLEYQPTLLTRVRLEGRRSLTDSSLIGVPGVIVSNLRLSVDHELLRELILRGHVEYFNDNYRGASFQRNRWSAGLGAEYQLSPALRATLDYQHRRQDSSNNLIGRNYSDNYVGIGLMLVQ